MREAVGMVGGKWREGRWKKRKRDVRSVWG